MAPRPSSPTSLLWAHQLKREHGYLLKRMQGLESANDKHENRIKTAETAAKANAGGDLVALAMEVKALDHSFKEGLQGMERDVTQKVEDVQAENEAMTMQIAALQKDEQLAEEERKENLAKDKALLQRIGEVEEGLKKYEESLGRIGKRINETQFDSIMGRLENLTKRVMEEGSQMKMVTESVRVLETAYAEISKRNAQLESELKEKASKTPVLPPPEPEEPADGGAEAEPTAGPANVEKPRKKKSHKWGGGGADKDIIRQGSSLIDDSPVFVRQHSPKASSAPKKSAPAPKKLPVPKKKKPAVPKTPAPDSSRKSHKWAGGGADRAIIAQGLSQDSNPIIKRELSEDTPVVQPKRRSLPVASGLAGKERVVRAGKGWIEVSRTPSPESEESSVPSKRGRGRPRKYPKPIQGDEDAPTVKRGRGRPRKYAISTESTSKLPTTEATTRRTIDQDQEDPTSKKRKVDDAFGARTSEPPSRALKKQKADMKATGLADHQLSNSRSPPVALGAAAPARYPSSSPPASPDSIFSFPYPPSSPNPSITSMHDLRASAQQGSTHVPSGTVTSQTEQVPQTGRRQIIQQNDDMSEIVRQMSG